MTEHPDPWEEQEADAAGREAAGIGGHAGDEDLDPAERPLVEGGEGEAEGFELAEDDLIEAAEHGDSAADPRADAFTEEPAAADRVADYGEADEEQPPDQ
jgi:hypothetical protein